MMTISEAACGLVRRAGLAAVAAVAVTAISHGRAEALSLASPAALPSAKYASDALTIEVRGGHHGGGFRGGGGGGFRGGGGGAFRGGGGGAFRGGFHGGGVRAFHGGGFRAGHVYRGGGFRAAHVYRGGGYRVGGYRIHRHAAYHRPYFHRRHHIHHRPYFHRRYYAPYYSYPRCSYPYRYTCRVVWTYYGPRKVCRCRLPVRQYYGRYGW